MVACLPTRLKWWPPGFDRESETVCCEVRFGRRKVDFQNT